MSIELLMGLELKRTLHMSLSERLDRKVDKIERAVEDFRGTELRNERLIQRQRHDQK